MWRRTRGGKPTVPSASTVSVDIACFFSGITYEKNQKEIVSAASSPPTTSVVQTTTETIMKSKEWNSDNNINNSSYGNNPSSLTIHITDKGRWECFGVTSERCVFLFVGSKYQSNLNEIDKFEQKSSNIDRKGNGLIYEYPSVKNCCAMGK